MEVVKRMYRFFKDMFSRAPRDTVCMANKEDGYTETKAVVEGGNINFFGCVVCDQRRVDKTWYRSSEGLICPACFECIDTAEIIRTFGKIGKLTKHSRKESVNRMVEGRRES